MNRDENTEHGEKFSFNANVTKCFSDMLNRSIPSYDLMRGLISDIIYKYLTHDGLLLDVGTSTGEIIKNSVDAFPNAHFIGLDYSDAMMQEAREKFKNNKNVSLFKHDLRKQYNYHDKFDVIVSCLTIQFTPIEYRLQILKNMYSILEPGGVFIFVEKVLGNSAVIDKTFVDIYYSMKQQNGYSYEEIQRKKLALEGVLVPVTAGWNEELLKISGFSEIDCFWRCLNFAGWMAIK